MAFQLDTGGTLEVGLEAYYKCEEASGTRFDATSANIDLTDNNGVTQNTGIVGNAAEFAAASTQFLSAPASTTALDFGPDGAMSMAGWVFLSSKPSNIMTIMGKSGDLTGQNAYTLFYMGSGTDRFQFRVSGDGANKVPVIANSFGAPSLNTWYFIYCSHDPVTNTLSISVNDGVIDTTSHSAGIFSATTMEFRLGLRGDGGSTALDGRTDEWGIWRKVLSSQEIADLYNGGSGNTLVVPIVTTQTIDSNTDIDGTTVQTIDSDSTILSGQPVQTIDADTDIIAGSPNQTLDSDTSIEGTTTQTIGADTDIKQIDITEPIGSAFTIVKESTQPLGSVTFILAREVDLSVFKESDLSTEVGTSSTPIAFGTVEAGTAEFNPDNPFVLFNDKGGVVNSFDARNVVISVLQLDVVNELVGSSDGLASQTFTVAFPPAIDEDDLITVRVNDATWTSVTTFVGFGPTDEIYTFDATTGTVTFGDGTQGKVPPIGNSIKVSYTPNTIFFGKEVSEDLWVSVQSNGVIENNVTVDLEARTPNDVTNVTVFHAPVVVAVSGVFLNTDPNRLGTNFFTGGTFDDQSGVITLGTSLPNTNPVLIDYTYKIADDLEGDFTAIGKTVSHAFANPIPSNNAKKLNFKITPPAPASPSGGMSINFKIRIEYEE